jgi:hypothetical protein
MNSISSLNSIDSIDSINSINWIIGERYELMEKGGAIYELGTLQAILENGSLQFKKADSEIHTYRVESSVSYRLIIHRLPQTPNTPNTEPP